MTLLDRCLVLTSQAVNALVFDGDPDESVSARAWRQRSQHPWGERCIRIDRWLGAQHCQRAFEEQQAREAKRK